MVRSPELAFAVSSGEIYGSRYRLRQIPQPRRSEAALAARSKAKYKAALANFYNALAYPRPALKIAQDVGVGKGTVHRTISEYNRHEPEALEKLRNWWQA